MTSPVPVVSTDRSPVRAGHGNILRDRHANKVDDEEEAVHDAEELERDAIEIHQQDGQAEGKEETGDQRRKGQPPAEFIGRFLPDRLQRSRIALGSLQASRVQRLIRRSPVLE